ncbi:PREDICTED: transmembrane protein 17B-like isoform X2 [Branchiostoma belcheri]|uniref:Transmembrane protein 17B-like isoform X1 n=1 Tax=Branchiostoma belcheri TaxID=7741 RepID=A0A6P5AAW3_BRABE|nr:PREDICTED: transmembrane protein 17B-like isoform X1 [Branchiostoma belcheri]XP_019646754.1 PREDICTED: transmembrane protein 17B-like isoform X2 [Branchiostoma belcheri]
MMAAGQLPPQLRQKLTSFAEFAFPATRAAREGREHHQLKSIGNELVSNLPLQMALYFNVCYFPFWLVTAIVLLQLKFSSLDEFYKFITVTVYVVMVVVEIVRLYLGYLGNLQEKVPELAGFWLLTIVLQFPLSFFILFNEATVILPLERAIHIVMAMFVLFEVVCGYFAIKIMSSHQVTKFHLRQFDDLEYLDDGQTRWTSDA